MSYKSKIGLEIVLPLSLVIGGTAATMVYEQVWIGLVVVALIAVFIAQMFTNTYYVTSGNELIIKSGFLFNQTIRIDAVKRISETRSPLSSPAASLDRLEIAYERFNTVMVSPKLKYEFITDLKQHNPRIEFALKAKPL